MANYEQLHNYTVYSSKVTAPQDAHGRLVLQVYLGSNTLEFSAVYLTDIHYVVVWSTRSPSLVPRPPPFFVLRFAFSIIHGSGKRTEEQRINKRGRPRNEATEVQLEYVLPFWSWPDVCMADVCNFPCNLHQWLLKCMTHFNLPIPETRWQLVIKAWIFHWTFWFYHFSQAFIFVKIHVVTYGLNSSESLEMRYYNVFTTDATNLKRTLPYQYYNLATMVCRVKCEPLHVLLLTQNVNNSHSYWYIVLYQFHLDYDQNESYTT